MIGALQPSFTADFSAIDTFTVRLEAPAGQFFLIDAPPEFDTLRSLAIDIGTAIDTPIATGPLTSLAFEHPNGDFPDLTGGFQDQDAGDFSFNLTTTIGGPFSFSALEATFDVPSGFNAVFTESTGIAAVFTGSLVGERVGTPFDDPGQFITLVPEPISLTPLGLGGLLLACRRRVTP